MKDVKGYEGIYTINKHGQVWRVKTQYLLTPTKCRLGYIHIRLCKDNKVKSYSLHRLLAIQFIPNPNNLPEVDHIDHNRSNNSLNNLRWVSSRHNKQNKVHQPKSGHTNIYIDERRKSSFNVAIVVDKKRFRKAFKTLEEAIDYRDNFYRERGIEL